MAYKPTLFTYNPEHSLNLRTKLAENQERLLAVQELLHSAVTPQSSQGVFSDIAVAQEKVTESLDFFATNRSATGSKAIKLAVKAFHKQKMVLAMVAEHIPANQKLLEETDSGIKEISLSREERQKRIESVKRSIKHLSATVQTLLAEIRSKQNKLEKEKQQLEELKRS